MPPITIGALLACVTAGIAATGEPPFPCIGGPLPGIWFGRLGIGFPGAGIGFGWAGTEPSWPGCPATGFPEPGPAIGPPGGVSGCGTAFGCPRVGCTRGALGCAGALGWTGATSCIVGLEGSLNVM